VFDLLKKRYIIIIAIVAAIAALAAAYFIFTPNWFNITPSLKLYPGELDGGNGRVLMRAQVQKQDMASVHIVNKVDDYTLLNDGTGELYLDGHPEFTLDPTKISSIVVNVGYLLSMTRVVVDPPDLSLYGLADSQDPITATVTTLKKETYTLVIGDKIPTTGGYYVKLADRNIVYVLDTTLETSVFLAAKDIIVPNLIAPDQQISQNDYFKITNFSLYTNRKLLFTMINRALDANGNLITEDASAGLPTDPATAPPAPTTIPSGAAEADATAATEETAAAATATTTLAPATTAATDAAADTQPTGTDLSGATDSTGTGQAVVPPDATVMSDYIMTYPTAYIPDPTVLDTILRTFISLAGSSVVAFGDDVNDATLAQYGLDNASDLITFTYKGVPYQFAFSLPDPNGDYYVISNQVDAIIDVPQSTFAFLAYDFIQFVDRTLFERNINDIAQIRVFTPDGSLNEQFDLTGADSTLVVTNNNTKVLTTDTFRQYYKTLLSIVMEDYETMPPGNPDPLVTLSITDRNGAVTEYKFYFVSTRRAFYTVNGVGNFYVIRDWVTKLISDTKKAAADIIVDSDAPN